MTDLVEKAQEAANRESGRFLSRPEILTVIAAVYDDLESTYKASRFSAGLYPHDAVSLLAAKRREVLGDE